MTKLSRAFLVFTIGLAGAAYVAGCDHDHHHDNYAHVDVVDEHGWHHTGYYDDNHAWHGGYYDDNRSWHDDPGDWHH